MAAPSFSSGNGPSSSSTITGTSESVRSDPRNASTAGTASNDEGRGWRAHLALRFSANGHGATQLTSRAHFGPLVVQRPFYPEGPAVPHVYVLHPPGGLVGGDRLRLDVTVDGGARALLTTPAATKIYRTAGPAATITQRLSVGQGGILEWLPQENILHDGAHADLDTRVELAADARFIGVDTLCFGLPARAETFAVGRCRQRLEIWRAGRPVVIERARFDASLPIHDAHWGLGGARVHGLLVVSPAPTAPEVLEQLRAAAAAGVGTSRAAGAVGAGDASRTGAAGVAVTGVTVLGATDALVGRYVGGSAEGARAFFQKLWTILRPAVLGRAAVPPRIWAT